jgi:uncharacterized protein (DUF1330 family)
MAAYVIADIDVRDPVKYEFYWQMVLPTITAYGGRFVAHGGNVETLASAEASAESRRPASAKATAVRR